MSLATQIIDQQVSGIVEKQSDVFSKELRLGADEHRRRSIAFLFFVAKTAFDLTDEQALDGIVDGGNDFGIDALYFEPPDDGELHVTLMQGKYKKDLDGSSAFPENGIEKMIGAIGALFDPARRVQLNRRLNERIEDVRSFVKDGAIPRVTAVAASNGTRWTEQAQQRIANARRDFGEQVKWRYIGSAELLGLLQAQQPINAHLHLIGSATVETFDFRRTLTGRMSVAELARLTDEYDNRLFEKNIRRYLGLAGNRVNEAVASTLRARDQRSNFYFYNNGVTVTCSQFSHNALQSKDWVVKVSDLQIVNGGQTARTVQQVAQEIGTEIADAEVLVRIYELPQNDAALVESITPRTARTRSICGISRRTTHARRRWRDRFADWAIPIAPSGKSGRSCPTSSRARSSPKPSSRSGATGPTRRGSGVANTSARCTARSLPTSSTGRRRSLPPCCTDMPKTAESGPRTMRPISWRTDPVSWRC